MPFPSSYKTGLMKCKITQNRPYESLSFSMKPTSAAHSSCQSNKKRKITQNPTMVEGRWRNSLDLKQEHKKPKEEVKEASKEKIVMYKECRKNHAASIGGYAVDGCREFMAAGEEEGLKCAACGCHRNFHSKKVEINQESSIECSSFSATNLYYSC